ncbi:LRP2 [Mytilus edulis]|uniref:LRP2 n=1 Tax=Mytilus edulis TaxID=6550 RepID=A0A8S3TCU8_MYTED|nr:LRP2 [Mytilus edulis]
MYIKVVLAIVCLTVVSVVTVVHGTRSMKDCHLRLSDDIVTSCDLCLPCSDGSGIRGYICRTSFCDGKEDCNNGGDEFGLLCQMEPCANTQWRCSDDKQCIHSSARCDGRTNCIDGSDEDPDACRAQQCSERELKCANKLECFHENGRCDGYPVCYDNSDEANCTDYMCSQGHWKCSNGLQCISEKRLCDGYIDCKDKSDESIQVCKGKVQYIYSNKGNKFAGLERKHVGSKFRHG